MVKKILVLSAAALMFQAVPALAEPGHDKGDRGAKMFEKLDADKDGVISEAEFLAKSKERFAEMDADKNGSVTQEEAKAAHEKMREKWKEHKAKKGGDVPPPPAE